MNKKGFTLVELVGVIAVIAILGVIVIPIIAGVLNNNSESLDKNQEELIKNAAKNYALSNAFKFDDSTCVTVATLKEQGYLENLSIESHSSNVNYNNYKVNITKNATTGNYEYIVASGSC